MGVVEELSVPLSLCCFALGAELEQIGEEWNDLTYPLYSEIGRVYGNLGG
jgi:hypothetical protein